MDLIKKLESKRPIAGIVLIFALMGILTTACSMPKLTTKDSNQTQLAVIPADETASKLLDFVNEIYGPQIGTATLKDVSEESGLYKVTVSVMNNETPTDQIIFVTRDGKLFVPQVMDMEDTLIQFHDWQQQMQAQPAVTPTPPDTQEEGEGEPEEESTEE